jgi:hypothetical protein
MEGALVYGRFTKEAERDLICALVFGSEGHARCQRNLAAHNRMPAKETEVRIEEVHRAAFATRTSGGLAIKLGHDGVRRHALGDRLAVLAVTRQYIVIRTQRRDRAHADSFLADIQVTEAADLPQAVRFGAFLFEATDQNHLMKYLHQRLAILWQRVA